MTYEQAIRHIQHVIATQDAYELRSFEKRTYAEHSYDLFSIQRRKRLVSRPTVCIVATLHGEEPAGTNACATHLAAILKTANEHRVNIVMIPCANPYGFDRGIRKTPVSEFMNGGYIHPELTKPSSEVKRLRTFLKKTGADFYLDLHEDCESHGAYVYAFNDRQIAKKLLQAVTRFIPIEKKPLMDDPDIMNADISRGIVFEAHDGSSEDMMSHERSCRFSAALETPSSYFPISVRARAHAEAIRVLIQIASRRYTGKIKHHRVLSKLIRLTRLFWTR